MGFINRKKEKQSSKHLNYMGGISYDIQNPLLKLKIASSSCFFGEPQYYRRDKDDKRQKNLPGSPLSEHELNFLREQLDAIDPKEWRKSSPAEIIENAIDEALDFNAEETLKFAVELRQNLNIRTTPQVILVRASKHPKVKGLNLISKYAPGILQRLDEPAVQMAYYLSKYGKPISSSLKRAWAKKFETASEYDLAKYRMEGREVKTVDVINVCHPSSDNISKLMKGQLKLKEEQKTWESVRSSGGSWEEASKVMGHMALLRNLRNLEQNGSLSEELLGNLLKGVPGGKQLPFRYYTAYRELEKISARGKVLDKIEECLEKSFENAPYFSGKVMSLVDNSGSAWGTMTSSLGTLTMAEIGNLMGVMTAKMSDEGFVGIFGDKYEKLEVRRKSSIFDTLTKVSNIGQGIGGSTEHGVWLFWEEAMNKNIHWDKVFIYSDMQAGHGGLYGRGGNYPVFANPTKKAGFNSYICVPSLVKEYREKVNSNVEVFLVQMAGYTDTLMPEFYDKTYILGGWSEKILTFANEMSKMNSFQR